MAKIWQKDYDIDALLEEFTVGIDYHLDLDLVRSDCAASIAHASQLEKMGLLKSDELELLRKELQNIAQEASEEKFAISRSDEDCHTAIENRLVEKLGDAGKRIHTGRSRNDQILVTLRLYTKARLLDIAQSCLQLIRTVLSFAQKHKNVPMPGRTHMQIAMPSSLGLWAGALAEQLSDDFTLLECAIKLVDKSPLGSAAGYGAPLDLDPSYTAKLLAFSKVFENVLAASNSRGKIEAVVLDALDQHGLTLSKYAQDLILFSLPEFGYFSLPDKLCSGSSIMPQKKNPDGLELLRSRSAMLSGWASQAKSLVRSLPTGYNRDFQDSKEPILRGLHVANMMVRIMNLTFTELEVHGDALRKAFVPEIYATDQALLLVAAGMPFREAYRQVGSNLDKLATRDPDESIANRRYPGTSGNLDFEPLLRECARLELWTQTLRTVFFGAIQKILASNLPL